MDRLASEESENTPIFHSLARRSNDPAEHFQRDPLRAPLPSSAPVLPARNRMLLHAVPPDGHTDQAGAAGHWGRVDSAADPTQEFAPPAGPREPRTTRESRQSQDGRGGRHRALRSVARGSAG